MENHKLFEVNQNVVIENNTGGILVLKKDGKWMLPGGRLEDNETWLEGLQREVKEETGIENFLIEKILNVDTSDSGKTYVVTFFVKLVEVPEIKLSKEHQECSWLDTKNIDTYEFWHEKIKERLTKFTKDR